MQPDRKKLPSNDEIRQVLKAANESAASDESKIEFVARRLNPYNSSFVSEIWSCRVRGEEIEILCKFDHHRHADHEYHTAKGHRRGPTYEGLVYGAVLAKVPVSSPDYYGTLAFPETGHTALLIAFMPDAKRVRKLDLLVQAAEWAANFHSATSSGIDFKGLLQHREDVYLAWSQRALNYAKPLQDRYPWFETVARFWDRNIVPRLFDSPQAIIHGEYYSENILTQSGKIFPIDWESAARGPVLLDIASLTDGWPSDVVDACLQAYIRKQPVIQASLHKANFEAAQSYWHMRWLGDRPDRTNSENADWRFVALRRLGEAWGILP